MLLSSIVYTVHEQRPRAQLQRPEAGGVELSHLGPHKKTQEEAGLGRGSHRVLSWRLVSEPATCALWLAFKVLAVRTALKKIQSGRSEGLIQVHVRTLTLLWTSQINFSPSVIFLPLLPPFILSGEEFGFPFSYYEISDGGKA